MAAAQDASQRPLRWRYGDVDDGNFAMRGRGVPLLMALLFALLCFIAVCLYLRWTCHRYNPDTTVPSSTSSFSSPYSAATLASSSVAGLDAATIASLPVATYQSAASSGDRHADDAAQCSICLGEFDEGEEVKALPRCGHCFHPECVDAWLRARPSCPLCRGSLLPDGTAATKPELPDVLGSDAV